MAQQALEGKVAIVTGAGSGSTVIHICEEFFGQSIAALFAKEGAHVIVNDISESTALETVQKIIVETGCETAATAFPCDVSDRSAVQRMVDFAVDKYGRLDIAVSNAYFSGRSAFLEQDFKEVQKTFEVTSYGAYHLCQLSARRMKEWTTASSPGRLIIIGSVMADYPYLIETSTAYNMAKASTDALTKTIASSLARHYITVNSIHPGWIDTQGERQFTSSEEINAASKHLPFGIGRPEDIAKGALYLAGDGGNYITGTILNIDGGFGIAQRIPGLHPPIVTGES